MFAKNSAKSIQEYIAAVPEKRQEAIIALANQKNYISIYVCALDGATYIAEKYAKELGKVNVGKSCIRCTSVDNLHLPTLKKVLKVAEKSPGLKITTQ